MNRPRGRSSKNGFLSNLWRSARRPPILRRCMATAAVVGTTLTTINLGEGLWHGQFDLRTGLKIVANYLMPFVVSNVGAMTSLPSAPSPEQ